MKLSVVLGSQLSSMYLIFFDSPFRSPPLSLAVKYNGAQHAKIISMNYNLKCFNFNTAIIIITVQMNRPFAVFAASNEC